jgi:hypothetical protein
MTARMLFAPLQPPGLLMPAASSAITQCGASQQRRPNLSSATSGIISHSVRSEVQEISTDAILLSGDVLHSASFVFVTAFLVVWNVKQIGSEKQNTSQMKRGVETNIGGDDHGRE